VSDTSRRGKRRWLAIGVPVGIAAAGVVLALYFVRTEERPQKAEKPAVGALVEIETARRRPVVSDVIGHGTVSAARVLEVAPEVGGRLEWVNPELVPGGIIRAGEPLFRIEKRAYDLAVAQQRSALAEARANLQLERSRKKVAERELELFQEDFELSPEADRSLVTREPQLEAARVAVESARAQLDRARLDLDRTAFAAPWDAYVRAESAEIGDLVSPQQPLATLVGIDRFWVEVAIPAEAIPNIAVPGLNAEEGSWATIVQEIGGRRVVRTGQVERLLGDMEERGRMARLLVRIDDPFGQGAGGQARDPDQPPLLTGAYVEVDLEGRQTVSLVELPREAVRGRDQVWVRTDRGTLEIRDIDIAMRAEDAVYVRSGLEDGDQVVTSPIARPIEGMRLRLAGAAQPRQARGGGDDG
jgi:RND family efflux transporter MFP subunit